MIASVGEIRIHWLGFWLQFAGLVFEAMRLVMIEKLLTSEDDKMDPLVSLYYYAPVCGLMNLVMVWFTEWHAFRMEDLVRVGPNILVFNAMVALCLNIAGVFLVASPFPITEDQTHRLLTRVFSDWKNKQPGHDTDWHLQEHPPGRRRRDDMGYDSRLSANVWVLLGLVRPPHLLGAFRDAMGTCRVYQAALLEGASLEGFGVFRDRRWLVGFLVY